MQFLVVRAIAPGLAWPTTQQCRVLASLRGAGRNVRPRGAPGAAGSRHAKGKIRAGLSVGGFSLERSSIWQRRRCVRAPTAGCVQPCSRATGRCGLSRGLGRRVAARSAPARRRSRSPAGVKGMGVWAADCELIDLRQINLGPRTPAFAAVGNNQSPRLGNCTPRSQG